jgi:hypothetical protein
MSLCYSELAFGQWPVNVIIYEDTIATGEIAIKERTEPFLSVT